MVLNTPTIKVSKDARSTGSYLTVLLILNLLIKIIEAGCQVDLLSNPSIKTKFITDLFLLCFESGMKQG